MLGWESIDGIRGIGIPCTEKFPLSESTIELHPENPKAPWFQLAETSVPPLQRAQMTYRVGWKVAVPPGSESQTFRGQIQVSSPDGAASVIPVSIVYIAASEESARQRPGSDGSAVRGLERRDAGEEEEEREEEEEEEREDEEGGGAAEAPGEPWSQDGEEDWDGGPDAHSPPDSGLDWESAGDPAPNMLNS
ncbi:Subtilase family protein [Cryptosporidium felis]|nr:Subtilase family protein [Cryptosporidium felis]